MHIWKPHVRANKLGMCKKQTSVRKGSTESGIISLDVQVYSWMEVGHLSVPSFFPTNPSNTKERVQHHQASTPTSTPRFPFCTTILNYAMSILFSHVKSSQLVTSSICVCRSLASANHTFSIRIPLSSPDLGYLAFGTSISSILVGLFLLIAVV